MATLIVIIASLLSMCLSHAQTLILFGFTVTLSLGIILPFSCLLLGLHASAYSYTIHKHPYAHCHQDQIPCEVFPFFLFLFRNKFPCFLFHNMSIGPFRCHYSLMSYLLMSLVLYKSTWGYVVCAFFKKKKKSNPTCKEELKHIQDFLTYPTSLSNIPSLNMSMLASKHGTSLCTTNASGTNKPKANTNLSLFPPNKAPSSMTHMTGSATKGYYLTLCTILNHFC